MSRSGTQFEALRASRRRNKTFDRLTDTIAESVELVVPPPVTVVERKSNGPAPKMSAEAYELARQVYYLHHGTIADAARALIAAGLTETDKHETVRERLRIWWHREDWPKRPTTSSFVIRDANHDGGLYRGRLCKGQTTGNGFAPAGKDCNQSAMTGSDYCFHHDPRPKYAAKRREQGIRLRDSRFKDMVPVDPFAAWCDQQRLRLLEEARAAGRAHPNARGWKMLSTWLGVDHSLLHRIIHSGRTSSRADAITVGKVRASTIVDHLANVDVTFEDIYGHAPPERHDREHSTCPECGRDKSHEAKTCMACYQARQFGSQCAYVKRTGERCRITTAHESGYCQKCRQTVQRIPRPRVGRPSRLTPQLIVYALHAWGEARTLAWAAQRMWVSDAGGIRSIYKNQASLEGALVKCCDIRGWTTEVAIAAAREQLLAEHGTPTWPPASARTDRPVKLAPIEPFRAWLSELVDAERERRRAAGLADRGLYMTIGDRTGIHPERVSAIVRGVRWAADQPTIRVDVAQHALRANGLELDALYPEAGF